MAKRTLTSDRKPSTNGYTYVGRTSDGVRIIEPKVRAKHFTREEIQESWERVFARLGRPTRAVYRPD